MLTLLSLLAPALADEPLAQRDAWEGNIEHFMSGVTLGKDADSDGDIDGSGQPASFDVTSADVPSTATLVAARLYWGGSQNQSSGACTSSSPDTSISLTVPDGSTLTVAADASYCADGGASSYDVWVSSADVTAAIQAAGGAMIGTWTVDDYVGKWSSGPTDCAGAALLLVYRDASLPPHRVVVYDGNHTMASATETLALTGFDADTVPQGALTYFVLEGDVGAGSGTEQVDVTGRPGGLSMTLSDAINPANNPMNRTINTTTPTQTGVTGVDIDRYDITSALSANDTQLDVTYQASTEKWWIAVNVVGVNQFNPSLADGSTKTWALHTDADGDGNPSPGDTVRYTIHLENTGNEQATVDVTDPIPPEAASWALVDAGGGTDASTASLLDVRGVVVAASASEDVVFDVVIGSVTDETVMDNTAAWSAPLEGGEAGEVTAPPCTIRVDLDGDDFYTNDECDDTDPAVNPDATEACNGIDDDCDGAVDETGGTTTFYADNDNDAYGAGAGVVACSAPTGYVTTAGDCDDTRDFVHPGATEVCNRLDDDCNGLVDDGASAGDWYADDDGDGYGDASDTVSTCEPPTGYVADDTDCDDTSGTIHPGAVEVPYDGIDQDCDGADLTDADGDGYSWDGAGGTDCDDTDAAKHPGAGEDADGEDDDCDGVVDEGTERFDDDGDGYTELGGDCDDAAVDEAPPVEEICDGIDQDCDGVVDEGTECYDDDGDGAAEDEGDCNDGDPDVNFDLPEVADNGVDDDCDGVVDSGVLDRDGDGYTIDGGDCDDEDAAAFPGAAEICDSVDQDCDEVVDEGTECSDDDGDGWTELFGDCNDADDAMYEGADEIPDNGRDDDCDGLVDEGGPHSDDDGDGYSELAGDCDDYDDSVGPVAEEVENGRDDDCDGLVDEGFQDLDGDGFTVADGDCDDEDGWVGPGFPELCDATDNDCDSDIDEGDACTDGGDVPIRDKTCGNCATGGPSGAWLLVGLVALLRRRQI